jgi:hypothetical protein
MLCNVEYGETILMNREWVRILKQFVVECFMTMSRKLFGDWRKLRKSSVKTARDSVSFRISHLQNAGHTLNLYRYYKQRTYKSRLAGTCCKICNPHFIPLMKYPKIVKMVMVIRVFPSRYTGNKSGWNNWIFYITVSSIKGNVHELNLYVSEVFTHLVLKWFTHRSYDKSISVF